MIKYFYGIQRKLLLYMMLLIVPALALVTAAVGVVAGNNVRENVAEQYGYVNEKYYAALQSLYERLETITESCITNGNVQNSLKNKELSVYEKEVLSRTLQFVDEGEIDSYLYMDNKDNVYTRNSTPVDVEKLRQSYLYQGLGADYSKVKLFWERDILTEGENKVLYAGRYVHQLERSYEPGVIYLRLDQMVLSDLTEAAGNNNPAYFLIDGKGEICYSEYPQEWQPEKKARSAVEKNIEEVSRKASGADTKSLEKQGILYTKKHPQSGFSVVTFVPNEVVYQMIWQLLRMIAIIFLLVLALAFTLSRFFAKQFTRPIRYISELMEHFDDSRLSDWAELHTNTELDDIGNSYNKMLERIAMLISQVRFKERELRKAELDTLMYQIQPHFLYNTLDTVYMLARISREETIMKMIQSLSRYLRINLSNGADKIPIEEELLHVQSYLDIQNIRKSGLFSYSISVDEKLKKLPVIKMILQPVAENSIKHAFEDCGEEPKIWISVKEQDNDVVFMVENNGTLMSAKDQERLNRLEVVDIKSIDSVVTRSKGGYGVWNVVKRLRLTYEEQIRFYYEVSAHKTSCVIKIRKEWMMPHENKKLGDGTLPDSPA